MSRSQKPSPMLSRAAGDGSRSPTADRSRTREQIRGGQLSENSRPEDVLDLLRNLVEEGQLNEARQLTVHAARRFPDEEEIQRTRRILRKSEATANPFAQPTTAAEIDWLDHPPEEARGKWVALIGSRLIAMAETLDELMGELEAKNLRQLPLVQRLAA